MKHNNGPSNQRLGKAFEDVFFKQAQLSGFLPIKNHIACQHTFNGRMVPVKERKGELDYRLISQSGKVGWFDCKTFEDDFFTFSQLMPEQVDMASLYNEYKIPAGFVVYFRKTNSVCYFPGSRIAKKGPGSRFDKTDAHFLGSLFKFSLKTLLKLR
jgi:penicillin-binding protein-related factor A (putative recombinase)